MSKKNVIIIGAAGRDFQNFNTCYRDNQDYQVTVLTFGQFGCQTNNEIDRSGGRKIPDKRCSCGGNALIAGYMQPFNRCNRILNVSRQPLEFHTESIVYLSKNHRLPGDRGSLSS